MTALSKEQLDEELKKLENWTVEDGVLLTGFEFEGFLASIDFVGIIADLAEEFKHHPRIYIDYNVVELELFTHDEKAITQLDIDFAHAVEQLPYLNDEEL